MNGEYYSTYSRGSKFVTMSVPYENWDRLLFKTEEHEPHRTTIYCDHYLSLFMDNGPNFGVVRIALKHENNKRQKYWFGTLQAPNRIAIFLDFF